METNITYNFDGFERATEMARQFTEALSEKNARQQIAAMAMQGMLSNTNLIVDPLDIQEKKDLAREVVSIADAVIAELKKKNDGKRRIKRA